MTIPTGKVSVKATPVSATVLAAGFVIVKVREVVPLSRNCCCTKSLGDGGRRHHVDAGRSCSARSASVDVTFPVVLLFVPAALPVTLIANVQEVLCASVAPPG